MVNSNISAYPWLCSTMPKTNDWDCYNSDTGNIVTKEEGYNAEAFTTDAYGTFGLQCVYYKISENLKRDKIFGEDQLQVVERAFNFVMYTEQLPPNVRTYQLQGIWGEDVLTCYVGITAFRYWSTYGGSDRNTPKVYEDFEPRIGDVIYLPQNDTFYEIRDVKYYQEAFGLQKHTYTLTLRVYKDTKFTIDTTNETISDNTDPIYQVATSAFESQYQINDPLKKNVELNWEELKKSKNVNHMDVLYDPNKDYNKLEAYAETIPSKFKNYDDELYRMTEETENLIDNMVVLDDSMDELRDETEQNVSNLDSSVNDIDEDLNNIDKNTDILGYKYVPSAKKP